MTLDESKIEILRRVEQGALSIEEGAHLLEILEAKPQSAPQAAEPALQYKSGGAVNAVVQPRSSQEHMPVPSLWRAAWGIFLWLGVAFMGLTGYWLYSSYDRSGLGVGFWFALFFLMVSCLIVFLGWQFIDSRWMAVTIHSHEDDSEKKFTLWAPLPLQFVKWVFNTFGTYMPEKVQAKNVVGVLEEMEQSGNPDEPFVIEIEGEKGSEAAINIEF